MDRLKHSLEQNAGILKGQVSKYALMGLIISIFAIILATFAAGYQMTGKISIDAFIEAQSSNIALWILNFTPLLFMFWGQSVSAVISYKAGAMIVDQTQELRMHTNEMASKAQHEASHDLLTNLPNRVLFVDRLNQAINTMRGKQGNIAVIMININNFKEINTGLGNYNADRLLRQFSQRLKNTVDEPITVARFGGDEFAILHPDVNRQAETIALAKKIQKAVTIQFVVDNVNIDIAATTGITFYPEHGKDPDTLIQRAGLAIEAARLTHNNIAVYEAAMDKTSSNRIIMMSELKKSIDSEQLMMFYQPKVNIQTGKVASCEALIRWEHPTFGMMSADKFVPMAERTGLIKSMTQYVIKQVIEDASRLRKKGFDIPVSLNLSAVDIVDIELPYTIESLLYVNELPANSITIEIIESATLSDHNRAIEVINKLADIGIKISIDDFGTGYSSFTYLTTLPISEIKIDKSFIMKIHDDKKKHQIVEAIINFAKTLKLSVVAEGVELLSHMKILKDMGCVYGQGYLFSKAIPLPDLIKLIDSDNPFPTAQMNVDQPVQIKEVRSKDKAQK